MLKNLVYLAIGFAFAAVLLDDTSAPVQSASPIAPTEIQPATAPTPTEIRPATLPTPVVIQPKTTAMPNDLVEPEKAEALFDGTRYVTGSRVNFRNGPSLNDKVLGSLVRGARVATGPTRRNWTRIRLPDGRTGWMSSQYLAISLPKVPETPTRRVAAPSARDITAAKREIIRQSIASYSGSCPCPYNTDRAGRRCGGRSAWSSPGGYSPICYESDVSESRLSSYLARRAPDR